MFPFIKKSKKVITPTYLISFPRSGSNFVQNVISKSTGTYNYSIYYFRDNSYKKCLTIKSHAPSYLHLVAEVARFIPDEKMPSRFIILWRDPRDIMISFYEFIQRKYNISLTQKEFLSSATNYVRLIIGLPPLSILEAYKVFVSSWRSDNKINYGDRARPWIEVKYENILKCPEPEFRKIFNFLDVDYKLDRSAIEEKVNLVPDGRSERCVCNSWEIYYKRYEYIINGMSEFLEPEIRALGYEE